MKSKTVQQAAHQDVAEPFIWSKARPPRESCEALAK